jgi:hypothetical protein
VLAKTGFTDAWACLLRTLRWLPERHTMSLGQHLPVAAFRSAKSGHILCRDHTVPVLQNASSNEQKPDPRIGDTAWLHNGLAHNWLHTLTKRFEVLSPPHPLISALEILLVFPTSVGHVLHATCHIRLPTFLRFPSTSRISYPIFVIPLIHLLSLCSDPTSTTKPQTNQVFSGHAPNGFSIPRRVVCSCTSRRVPRGLSSPRREVRQGGLQRGR